MNWRRALHMIGMCRCAVTPVYPPALMQISVNGQAVAREIAKLQAEIVKLIAVSTPVRAAAARDAAIGEGFAPLPPAIERTPHG